MVDQERLQSALREFAHTLVRRYEVGDVLYRLSDDVTDVLGVACSGVSLLESGVLRFVTATNDTVEEVERLQDHFGQGACVEATTTKAAIVVDDLHAALDRCPTFAPAALERGLAAVLGIPMHLEGTTIGALNVYDDQPRAWSDAAVTAAQVLADMATAYIVMVGKLRSAEQLADQLQHALDSRVVIEQAKGRARHHPRHRRLRGVRTPPPSLPEQQPQAARRRHGGGRRGARAVTISVKVTVVAPLGGETGQVLGHLIAREGLRPSTVVTGDANGSLIDDRRAPGAGADRGAVDE